MNNVVIVGLPLFCIACILFYRGALYFPLQVVWFGLRPAPMTSPDLATDAIRGGWRTTEVAELLRRHSLRIIFSLLDRVCKPHTC